DYNTTGDGILSAAQLAATAKKNGKKVSELNTYMELLPQVLCNARVLNEKKYDYLENALLVHEIEKLEKDFEGRGRVLIRPSGTEPLVRVMIEGRDIDEITKEAERLAKFLEDQLA
ncbi:MAG: phosphoglucosamine mutase, partial [Clostridiales bacterium]|nr:phosphoglucosamine mutase [Clostridiales bacterium]